MSLRQFLLFCVEWLLPQTLFGLGVGAAFLALLAVLHGMIA